MTDFNNNIENKVTDREPIVKVRGLCKSFGSMDILKGVDLSVQEGENLVVLGKSGVGKSVLIKCMVGLIEYDSGEIHVFGNEIAQLNERQLNELRLKMGFLFQSAALYDSMSVRENLSFPLIHHRKDLKKDDRDQVVLEALEQVGLADAIDKMPSELSGGMSKRVGLARTLIMKPAIMLYDEPTTGLDTITSREISELILSMQKKNNISSIIITHDMVCAKMTGDRIIVLKEGVIVATGTYDELAASDDEWVQSFFV